MGDSEKIKCCASLKPYLESLFANKHIEDLFFSRRLELVLAEYCAGADEKSVAFRKKFILSGVGVRSEVGCKSFEGWHYSTYEVERQGEGRVEEIYRFHVPNAAQALAYALAQESDGTATPEMLEQRIASFVKENKPEE